MLAFEVSDPKASPEHQPACALQREEREREGGMESGDMKMHIGLIISQSIEACLRQGYAPRFRD